MGRVHSWPPPFFVAPYSQPLVCHAATQPQQIQAKLQVPLKYLLLQVSMSRARLAVVRAVWQIAQFRFGIN